MKTARIFMAAFIALAISSCQKEETIQTSDGSEGTVITCSFSENENETRTFLATGSMTPLWDPDDNVLIYDAANPANKKVLKLIWGKFIPEGETPEEDQGVISDDYKTFTFTMPSGWSDTIGAIYPASAFVGFDGNDPKITFANQNGYFEKANICAGTTSTTVMSFKNVGAIIEFTSKPSKVMNIELPIEGMKNDFKVTFSDSTPALTADGGSHKAEVDLEKDEGLLHYIGVPASTIPEGSTFKYRTASRGLLSTYTTTKENTIERNKIYNLGTIGNPSTDLSFSVSSSKHVYFSKGNLWCDTSVSPATWSFEDDQFGTSNIYSASHVSLFYWETADNYGAAESFTGSEDDSMEWGTPYNRACNYSINTFTTLSIDEWAYLINSRTDAAEKIGYATVGGINGLIILPDSFTDPEKNNGNEAFVPVATSADDRSYSNNIYTSGENWDAMEAAGAVFLPSAGERNNNSTVLRFGQYGYYWSSTPNDNSMAYGMYFNSKQISTGYSQYRYHAHSIRLVSTAR